MSKIDESTMIVQSSSVQQDSFQHLCKSCQLQWKDKSCPAQKPVKRICIDAECELSIFLCNAQTCEQCYGKHKICTTVQLDGFIKLLNQLISYQKTFFKKLYQIDQQLIEKIKASQRGIAKMISIGSLDEENLKIINFILLDQIKADKFIGKQVLSLYNKLRSKVKEKHLKQNQLQNLFSKRADDMINENIRLKSLIFQKFLKGGVPNVPEVPKPIYFTDSPLLTMCINELYTNTPEYYKKKVYNNYGHLQFPDTEKMAFQKKHIDFLTAQLGNPKSSTLLFRASEHNFQAAQFHAKCDTKANTLTIIKTQHRKTIFAFAAQAWSSAGSYVNDTTGKSCIIWLDTLQKLTMTNAAQSIYCDSSTGPIFGECDICINNGATGQTNFPNSYNNNKGGASQTTYTMMTGNPNGSNFNILQYEVYQLVF